MGNASREQCEGLPGDPSDEFFRMVMRHVDFADFAPNDAALRDRIVRLTVLGQPADAMLLVHRSSALGEKEAQNLINRIERTADQVFYATGLRPALTRGAGRRFRDERQSHLE